MDHLKKNSLPVPNPILSVSGENISVMNLNQPNDCLNQVFVRALNYLPGILLSDVELTLPLCYSFGKILGKMDQILLSFNHSGAHRYMAWDLANSKKVIVGHLPFINDNEKRTLVQSYISLYDSKVLPILYTVRKAIIHGDPNDHNILVTKKEDSVDITGILDFGDFVYSHIVNEISIAGGYAMLGKPDPIKILVEMVAGYHTEFPLTLDERKIVYILACMRLCTSAVMGSYNITLQPENAEYLQVHSKPAWEMLDRLKVISPESVFDILEDRLK